MDSMDKYLLELLGQRMDIVREIGYYKLARQPGHRTTEQME